MSEAPARTRREGQGLVHLAFRRQRELAQPAIGPVRRVLAHPLRLQTLKHGAVTGSFGVVHFPRPEWVQVHVDPTQQNGARVGAFATAETTLPKTPLAIVFGVGPAGDILAEDAHEPRDITQPPPQFVNLLLVLSQLFHAVGIWLRQVVRQTFGQLRNGQPAAGYFVSRPAAGHSRQCAAAHCAGGCLVRHGTRSRSRRDLRAVPLGGRSSRGDGNSLCGCANPGHTEKRDGHSVSSNGRRLGVHHPAIYGVHRQP